MPNELKLDSIAKYINSPIEIPKNPKNIPKKIKTNLSILKCNSKEKLGTAKEVSPAIATIMIEIGLTILALTAASPKTRAPTILMVELMGEGTRMPCFMN